MVLCNFIITDIKYKHRRYCKKYSSFNCNFNKMQSICHSHATQVLSRFAKKIQHHWKSRKLKSFTKHFILLPIDIKQSIIDYIKDYEQYRKTYLVIANIIQKRINTSYDTLHFSRVFYTRYHDIYYYFRDNKHFYKFCDLIHLINKYYKVIKHKIDLKNFSFITEELEKIYFFCYNDMDPDELNEWTLLIDNILPFKKLKKG